MSNEALGICGSTLLVDPMTIDGDVLRSYLDAAAGAGFESVSLWGFHIMFAGDDATAAVRASGLDVGCVEAAIGWVDGPSEALNKEIDMLISLGTELGSSLLAATCLGSVDDHGAAVAGLAVIAQRAAEADMSIALEFLPWTGLPTFAAANTMCVETGYHNATVLLDTWHWVRQPGGPDLDMLRSVPGSRVAYLQVCDVNPEPSGDTETEALTARLLPGDGIVDFDSILAALSEIGSDPFIAAEVFNKDLSAMGPQAMAKSVAAACREVFRR